MSLLQPVRGRIPVDDPTSPERLEAAARRLCDELLAWNRLRPDDVVAARFVGGASLRASPVPAARAAGWGGIPIFFTRAADAGAVLEVEAHVRLRRKRRLRPLELT